MSDDTRSTLMLGETLEIRRVREMIARVGPSRIPVLIEGETGAGKELVAQALHAASGRRGKCVAVNVCAISDGTFEDALFGHVRGAYTGALGARDGFLAEADGGSLFLDEIGGLTMHLQMKLLRALETGEYRPLGAGRDRHSDFRVIAATNEQLDVMVRNGRFRADLSHRLCGVRITVPSLRDRLSDLPLLALHFLHACGAGARGRIDEAGLRELRRHPWPGNVRELQRVIECALLIAGSPALGADDIRIALSQRPGRLSLSDDESFMRRRLIEILESASGDTAKAAERLGVHRATLYRQMRQLGVRVPEVPSGVDASHPVTPPTESLA